MNLARALDRQLSPPLLTALRAAAAMADDMHVPCYLVGGPVRDLILGRTVDDIDLVLEGDAVAVATRFATSTGGRLTKHTAFGTANVSLTVDTRAADVDFVTARSETYPEPAALPVVQPGSLADDLHRRDFTINTLALSLQQSSWGDVVDLCGGLDDLQRRLVRVLHDRSFVDDPTRIVRAARFAARLDFALQGHTQALIEQAVASGMIECTSPIRILHELWLCFREPQPGSVFEVLDGVGALRHIVPGLVLSADLIERLNTIRRLSLPDEERRKLQLLLVAWRLPGEWRAAFLARYPLSSADTQLVAEADQLDAVIAALRDPMLPPSGQDQALAPLSDTSLELLGISAPPGVRETIAYYRAHLRSMRSLLNGDDLRAMGIPPGPRYRELLHGLRAAQLDGLVQTRDEAELWIKEHL